MNELRGLWRGKGVDPDELIEGYFSGYYLNESKQLVPHIMRSDNGDLAEVIPETLRECTGLPDKNGKPIFEGDIVEYKGVRYQITYLKDFMRFSAVRPNSVFSVFNYTRSEIIGNIHDNPELLEQDGDDNA